MQVKHFFRILFMLQFTVYLCVWTCTDKSANLKVKEEDTSKYPNVKTIVLQPASEGTDTYVCDCKPKVNNPNGPVTHLYQGQYKSCFDRLLIRWDFTSLPENITIDKAIMELKCINFYGSRSGDMVYYMITEDWKETGVTCATRPGYSEDDPVIIDRWPSPGERHTVNITKFVQRWYEGSFPNYGIYGHSRKTTGLCCAEFYSSDCSYSDYRPKLTIIYSSEPDSSLKK